MAAIERGAKSYKGKVTHRSWPQLPPDLLRHIATFYLWDLAASAYSPQTWDTREHWHPRLVFTTLRDANDLEKHMMDICPQWHLALQSHLFWQKAVALIDPNDVLAHYAIIHPKPPPISATNNSSSAQQHQQTQSQPTRLSPHHHFRNITQCSCLVCRINSPNTNLGLTSAKTHVYTPYLIRTGLCRDHSRRPASFCGLCLRDAPAFENLTDPNAHPTATTTAAAAQINLIAIIENEDKESFPNVDATCRTCRAEWLWRRVADHPTDRAAIGGRTMSSEDFETRSAVESFVDVAEGCIRDVVMLAREKYWLRGNTRLTDMLEQAVAAARYNRGGRVGYGAGVDEEEEEEEEEDEEDEEFELMQMEENGVRELALSDWARMRIMDGHWVSPADFWYGHKVPGKSLIVRAVHPCPWSRENDTAASSPSAASSISILGDEEHQHQQDEEDQHPRRATINGLIPPTFRLCQQAFVAHQGQLRTVLIPAMRNLVRKIVIECSTPGLSGAGVEDPAIRAARMSVEDVLAQLREDEGVWFDGFDWAERGLNDRREREKRERERQRERDDASTTSSSSPGSRGEESSSSSTGTTTSSSPVLSTSTLGTTPSPPPIPVSILDEKDEEAVGLPLSALQQEKSSPRRQQQQQQQQQTRPITIPVAPVLDPPRLLPSIPYVPVTAGNFPLYTMDALKMVWREACAPLYHCRCRICQRASAKANGGSGASQQQPGAQQQQNQPQQQPQLQPPAVIVFPPQQPKQKPQERGRGLEEEEEEEEEQLVEMEDLLGEEMEEMEEEEEEYLHSLSCSEGEEEGWYTPEMRTPQPVAVVHVGAGGARKRGSEEVDCDEEEGCEEEGEDAAVSRSPSSGDAGGRMKSGTPPKRARRDDGGLLVALVAEDKQVPPPPPLPRRMRKRSSEEVDGVCEDGAGGGGEDTTTTTTTAGDGLMSVSVSVSVGNKRVKMSPPLPVAPPRDGVGLSPPSSTTTTRSSSVSLGSGIGS